MGTRENCSATWLEVSGFMVMELVSGFSLPITLTQGPSLWHTHCSAKTDSSEKGSGRWKDTWCFLLTCLKFFLLVVAY